MSIDSLLNLEPPCPQRARAQGEAEAGAKKTWCGSPGYGEVGQAARGATRLGKGTLESSFSFAARQLHLRVALLFLIPGGGAEPIVHLFFEGRHDGARFGAAAMVVRFNDPGVERGSHLPKRSAMGRLL